MRSNMQHNVQPIPYLHPCLLHPGSYLRGLTRAQLTGVAWQRRGGPFSLTPFSERKQMAHEQNPDDVNENLPIKIPPAGQVQPNVSVSTEPGSDEFEIDIRITIRPGKTSQGGGGQPGLGGSIFGSCVTCGGSCPFCPPHNNPTITCGNSCPVCIHDITKAANTCSVTCVTVCNQLPTCIPNCLAELLGDVHRRVNAETSISTDHDRRPRRLPQEGST